VKEMGDKHGWMAGVGVISECVKSTESRKQRTNTAQGKILAALLLI